jgi:hypothetical protein
VLAVITAAVAVFGATATAMTVIDSAVPPVSAAPATLTSTSQPVESAGGGAALPSSGQFTEQPAGSDDLVANTAPASGQDLVAFATAASDRAHELAEAMHSWAGCVSQSASTSSGAVDLTKTCGPQPRPSDYGLTPLSTPPGQANKDNPNPTPPGQANKDNPNPTSTPPGQANKDNPNPTPPGQANKDDETN